MYEVAFASLITANAELISLTALAANDELCDKILERSVCNMLLEYDNVGWVAVGYVGSVGALINVCISVRLASKPRLNVSPEVIPVSTALVY